MEAGTIIVGGGVGGLRCAERLRRNGYEDPISIVSAEGRLPYDRPTLSKAAITDEREPQPQWLTSDEKLAESRINLIEGRAVQLNRTDQQLILEDGRHLPYDYLVLATGAVPREVPPYKGATNTYILRKWEEALQLRKTLRAGGNIVVVGAGVLGLEIAASARTLGCTVDVIDFAPTPVSRLAGPDFGEAVKRLHEQHGNRLHLGITVDNHTESDGNITSITLNNGTTLKTDAIVVAIGAVPELTWLESSGLLSDNALKCDEQCRTVDEKIFALGDVATIRTSSGEYQRHEHFTNAVDTAALVAAGIAEDALGTPQRRMDELPYVWSDQFGIKIQILGTANHDEPLLTVHDDVETGQKLQLSTRDGQVVAAIGWNMPAAVNRCRIPITQGAPVEELLEHSPWVRKVPA